jgi:hypothetical protein
VQRQFITNLDFTAGMATNYDPGPLIGDTTYLDLAAGYEPGRRFHSAEVIRLSDAKRLHLGHVHRADGRWRLYAFADAVDPRNPAPVRRAHPVAGRLRRARRVLRPVHEPRLTGRCFTFAARVVNDRTGRE